MQAKSHENKTSYNWNEVTLCNMLKNEVYIGNTVQNKRSIISYKVKKFRTVDKEEHIRVENTHEAIIDKDTFEKVQRIIEKRGTNTKLKYDYIPFCGAHLRPPSYFPAYA